MKILFKLITFIILFCTVVYAEGDCVNLTKRAGYNGYDDAQVRYAFSAATATGKNCVQLSADTWRFQNPIVVPNNFILKGSYTEPHDYDANGTTIECTYAPGYDSSAVNNFGSCIVAMASSSIEGLNMVWPGNLGKTSNPTLYPWGIYCRWAVVEDYPTLSDPGRCNVKNVTMVNPVYGINFKTEGNDHHLKGVNISPYIMGVFIDNISSLGIIEDVKISPDYMEQYYGFTKGDTDSKALRHYTYNNTIAFQFNRTDWGDIKNIYIADMMEGYRFDLRLIEGHATYDNPFDAQAACWQNPQIYIVNTTCEACNYAIHAFTIQKPAGIQIMSGTLEGKIRIEGYNWGALHIASSTLKYIIDSRETQVLSHIHDVSKNSNIIIVSSNIIEGSNNPNIPFNAASIFTSGMVSLSDVTIRHASGTGAAAVNLTVYGSRSYIAWTDGYVEGSSSIKMTQFNDKGTVESKVTRVGLYNVQVR